MSGPGLIEVGVVVPGKVAQPLEVLDDHPMRLDHDQWGAARVPAPPGTSDRRDLIKKLLRSGGPGGAPPLHRRLLRRGRNIHLDRRCQPIDARLALLWLIAGDVEAVLLGQPAGEVAANGVRLMPTSA